VQLSRYDSRPICQSYSLAAAGARSVDLIAARLRLQAYSLSIIDGFLLIAWSCACALNLSRAVAQVTTELWRPECRPADTDRREGVKIMRRKALVIFIAAVLSASPALPAKKGDPAPFAHHTTGSGSVGAEEQPQCPHRSLRSR